MEFPKIIDDGLFTIGDKIGNGAFGVVFKAKKRNGKDVAIKFEAVNAQKKFLQNEIEVGRL